jgi:hypothetical protein
MNPYHYIVANKKKGYKAKIRADENLVGILVVNKNSTINNIEDVNDSVVNLIFKIGVNIP